MAKGSDYIDAVVEGDLPGALRSIKQTPEGAVIVGVLGGALGFFVAGPAGAIKLGLMGARLGDSLFGVESGPPRATASMPAPVPATAQRQPAQPRREPPVKVERNSSEPPVLWVKAKNAPRANEEQSRPWILEGDGVRIGLLPGFNYAIGRDEAADIRIFESGHKGDTVSRHHASLGIFAEGLYFIDEGSRNGTWVDSGRVGPHEAMILKARTEVRLGKFVLVAYPAPNDVSPP